MIKSKQPTPLQYALTFLFLIVLFGIVTFALLPPKELNPQNSRFKVVDTYKNCEVIRYTPDGNAKYAYFLECRTP